MIQKDNKDRNKSFGIRKRYLRYTLGLLVLAMILSGIGIWFFVKNNISNAIIEKYNFLDEKMGLEMDRLFQKSEEVMADCIVRGDVQKSLKFQTLEDNERKALSKYFAYVDLEDIAEYFYIDNKQNIYTRSYSSVSYEQFQKSGFANLLGEEYAEMKWIWTKDTLFGTNEEALFIGRYVRSMEYAHEPGMLYFKMEDDFLDTMIGNYKKAGEEITVGVTDSAGKICNIWFEDNYPMESNEWQKIIELLQTTDKEGGMIIEGKRIQGAVVSAYRQKETGFVVFTVVPDEVIWGNMAGIVLILIGIYVLVFGAALVLSMYFANRFTKPIRKISDAMAQFQGNDFSKIEELHTNTELDFIGDSYNEMLGNIEQLLEEVKQQEKALRKSELNALISQINPHFLYNTLDTIYVLARLNHETTTMQMIHALSRYLKVTLSKGNHMISLEDELDNAKSYMQIQQIRNRDLFEYEIDCRVDPGTKVQKLILQPIVENAIKYGFCEIFEGGYIKISIWEEADELILQVYNNGKPIESELAEKINAANGKEVSYIKEMFQGTDHGYGVINIMTRLRLRYGQQVQLRYQALDTGTECTIKIPKGEGQNDVE